MAWLKFVVVVFRDKGQIFNLNSEKSRHGTYKGTLIYVNTKRPYFVFKGSFINHTETSYPSFFTQWGSHIIGLKIIGPFSTHKGVMSFGGYPHIAIDKPTLDRWCHNYHAGWLYLPENFLQQILGWVDLYHRSLLHTNTHIHTRARVHAWTTHNTTEHTHTHTHTIRSSGAENIWPPRRQASMLGCRLPRVPCKRCSDVWRSATSKNKHVLQPCPTSGRKCAEQFD